MRSFLERVPPSELHHVLVPDQSGLWTALLDTLCRFMNVEGEALKILQAGKNCGKIFFFAAFINCRRGGWNGGGVARVGR